MRRIDSRQKLKLSAAAGVALWLIAIVATVLWWRPEFWIDPGDRFVRARELADQRRFSESVASIDAALAAEPRNTGLLIFKGYRQLDLNNLEGAHRTFTRAIELDPTSTEARIGSATALARMNRREEALAAAQELSSETIGPSQLHRRSQIYAQLGARHLALEDLSLLLHAEPANPTYLKDAAELALMDQDWDRAAPLLQRLDWATADPHVKHWVATNREVALEAAGQSRRAQAHALRAAGNARQAEATFRELLARDTADVATRQDYAWLLNTQRRYAEAWKVLEPLPRPALDVSLLELQARTAIWAGQTAESVHLIRALLERRPNDSELWRRLGEAWQTLGDDRQAAAALAVHLRLQSNDWRARERLAQILTKLGSLEDAIAEYRRLLLADPGNPDFLRSLGLIQETGGELEAAADSYLRALNASPSASPELLLRLARLHKWMARPEAAVPWYERYLQAVDDDRLRRPAQAELAISLLDSGNPAGAWSRLRALGGATPLDAGELIVAARAATAVAQPAEASRYLEMLAGLRPLTAEEELWLAGQYRAAGNLPRALASYERLAAATTKPDRALLEAIGDLRYDLGDYSAALHAFQQIPAAEDLALKLARTAARAGEFSLASDTYDRYVRSHPNDARARLEAARYHASAGRPQLAINHYRVFVSAHGSADLRLELARTYLAAQQFEPAEDWARQAVAAGEDAESARLALAQSLHLQGRHREARVVLAELLRDASAQSSAWEWRGYIAAATDRHLEAFRSFDRAIASGASEPQTLLLLKGTAALKRADYARAAESYAAAARVRVTPATSDAARRLRALTLPTIQMPVWSLRDSNDLRVTQVGAGVIFFLPSFRASVSLEGSGGSLRQRTFSSGVNSFTLGVADLFPTPEGRINLALGINQYNRAPDLVTWQATGLYYLTEEATIGVDAGREALVAVNARRELRQFSRVLDLRAVGPGFHTNAVRAHLEFNPRGDHRARAESGFEKFQDGNLRSFVYLHYQIPVASSARVWTAIRPDVFFETFRDRQFAYFSPKRHVTIGTMLHTIRRYARWEIEGEINPQLLHTDGNLGVGGHGLLNIGAKLGPASLNGGAFVFWDGLEDHLQWRLGGRISIPLAK